MIRFQELVSKVQSIGLEHHRETILENSKRNAQHVVKTIRDIPPSNGRCLIISAGPSLYRRESLKRIHEFGYRDEIIATDGAYIQCLKNNIIPDYVITLDPHPTRMVRWFGDRNFEKNSEGDDYFKRQDLDVTFREQTFAENLRNVGLVDQYKATLVICSTSPANVVYRTKEFCRYWFAPLVDDPLTEGSLTREIVEATGLPAMNTGGTIGNAAWVFAHQILKANDIAAVGMDFGYPLDTPLEKTQSWNMLKGNENPEDFYPRFQGHWGEAYTDPTYYFYRQALLDMLEANDGTITNCTEGGLLIGDRVICKDLDKWLKSSS